jgi:hypothetical protein
MDVTEIRAQFWHVPLDVDPGAIPGEQRLNGKSVPKVVQPWTTAIVWASQPDLS